MTEDAAAHAAPRLKEIAQAAVQRYRERFSRFGYDPRALGWGSAEQQGYRFSQTLAGPLTLRGSTVLDIGCGFGDYRAFLESSGAAIRGYEGWDINPDLVDEARRRLPADSPARFAVRDFMDPQAGEPHPVADVGLMLGVLNFNLSGKMDNYAYSELAMRRAWALSKRALIVDFLSARRVPGYAAEPWVFHHEPERMLAVALSLSPRVTLKHDYLPIPQREFMLFIERE